jgi:hypothetical protein
MSADNTSFFSACLSAGAILSGFCGTFLSFRIQREATYYRQPAVDFDSKRGKDIYLRLSHFTSSFLLLIIASVLALSFGFALPLLALADVPISRQAVVAGMLAAVVFVGGYFICEMVHYEILSSRLLNDSREWGRSTRIVAATFGASVLVFILVFRYV